MAQERSSTVEILTGISRTLESLTDPNRLLGSPVSVQGRTLVPVAMIAFGLGGGGGAGEGRISSKLLTLNPASGSGFGDGGGGGASLSPVGVIEIGESESKLYPV
ncbi:MAG TPA: spore germination protein GerW family protein [Acidobacteriota bacterium]